MTHPANSVVRVYVVTVRGKVTDLKRMRVGGFELGDLAAGAWREISRAEVGRRLPAFKV